MSGFCEEKVMGIGGNALRPVVMVVRGAGLLRYAQDDK
jgi:hypothetical protein